LLTISQNPILSVLDVTTNICDCSLNNFYLVSKMDDADPFAYLESPEFQKKFDVMRDLVQKFRGQFITEFVEIEFTIEMIIASYYCDHPIKLMELLHSILTDRNFNFEFKRRTLGFIVKNHYPHFEESHPKIIKRIGELNETRNELAHKKVFMGEDNVMGFNLDNQIIEFTNLGTEANKIGMKPLVMSVDKMTKLLTEMGQIHDALFKLSEEIRPLRKGSSKK
jgi:hypothetical protein